MKKHLIIPLSFLFLSCILFAGSVKPSTPDDDQFRTAHRQVMDEYLRGKLPQVFPEGRILKLVGRIIEFLRKMPAISLIILGALILGIFYMIVRKSVIYSAEKGRMGNAPGYSSPGEVSITAEKWGEEAMNSFREGDYARSVIQFYRAFVYRLFELEVIPNTDRLTNSEIRRQLKSHQVLLRPFENLAATAEKITFKHKPADMEEMLIVKESYARCFK